MKYYIITGEASGDLHASNLIRSLRFKDHDAEFRAWGGDLMEEQGAELVKHYRDLAFMGFVEVLLNIRTILRNIRFCKKDILSYQPDVLILVDYPGFNLRIAEFAHNNNFKVFYYISPQLWAWKQSRIKKIKSFVDKMFVILPFEKEFYEKHDCDVEFVGHPLLDAIEPIRKQGEDKNQFILKNKLEDKPIITLLPGSRKQEISIMLPLMLKMVKRFKEYQFIIGATSAIPEKFYQKIINSNNVSLLYHQTYYLLMNSVAAIVTSGTASLETALFDVPEVVCYKGSYLSYLIAKRLVNVKYIALPNLIVDREIVKELIQNHFNADNLESELDSLLNDDSKRTKVKHGYAELKEKLGGTGASLKTATSIINHLQMTSH